MSYRIGSRIMAIAMASAGLLLVPQPTLAQASIACEPMADRMPLEGRASPYDSVDIRIGDATARICYGRPSARGRTMIGGGAVPYGQLWRTGANEPTTLHLPVAAEIAGIAVEPGTYSIYTIPGLEQWVVIINESVDQWGHEGAYSSEVRGHELGRAVVEAERLDEHVETLTIRGARADDGDAIVLEWENTRVKIPFSAL